LYQEERRREEECLRSYGSKIHLNQYCIKYILIPHPPNRELNGMVGIEAPMSQEGVQGGLRAPELLHFDSTAVRKLITNQCLHVKVVRTCWCCRYGA